MIVYAVDSIDYAWCKTAAIVSSVSSVRDSVTVEITPSTVADKYTTLWKNIDKALRAMGTPTIRETAFTIFPYETWLRNQELTCEAFSNLCVDRLYPRMKSRSVLNRYGVYFERIMGWQSKNSVGQLSAVVQAMKLERDKRPRESLLQIAIYDPSRDLTNQPRRGFPCLQQITLSFLEGKSFCLTALYPVQYVFDRAYGNYLGLYRLGKFIESQSNWKFQRLSVIALSPKLGKANKSLVRELITTCEK